ncbi:hypothetical protein LKB41_000482 [Salmonella enterica]|nr:hypothetical protein [Salmonella enterica]EGW0484917.1 hypothetical protein [Salmonella enterica]EIK6229099.1 hypothetical protein [Salmonella enterica]ELZ1355728.1 hypothetical protein [Salmonella enterica]
MSAYFSYRCVRPTTQANYGYPARGLHGGHLRTLNGALPDVKATALSAVTLAGIAQRRGRAIRFRLSARYMRTTRVSG